MRKVTLLFPDEKSLEQFAAIVSCILTDIRINELSLICKCGDAEIELAENGFNAKIVAP